MSSRHRIYLTADSLAKQGHKGALLQRPSVNLSQFGLPRYLQSILKSIAILFTGDFIIFLQPPDLIEFISSQASIFKIAILASLVLFGLILLSLVILSISRILFLIKCRHNKKVESIWLPLLDMQSTERPQLLKNQWPHVLHLWVSRRAKSTTEDSARLDKIALDVGLNNVVFELLTPRNYSIFSRPIWLRILAITAAQWFPSSRIIGNLWGALASNNRSIALRACTSLVSLKAEDYEKAVIKILFRFPEQAPTITTEIGAAGGGEILHVLEPFLDRLPNYTITNFISLAERSTDKSLLPLIIEKLETYRNSEEAGSLLRALGNLGGYEQRSVVIPFLNHETHFLRIQAAKTLGRIGDLSDIPLIIPLLSDENWWFRYRAAEAIVNLGGKNYTYLQQMLNSEKDPIVADILQHVLTEKNWSTA